MIQPMLFDFDGKTYDREKDQKRLMSEFQVVTDLMKDGRWRTLERIATATGFPESAISARLRDHRKTKVKSQFTMECERVSKGLWKYRLVPRVRAND